MDTLKNLAYGVVLTPPTTPTAGTSLTLNAGHGARFPAVPFNVSVWPFGVPADPGNTEIVRVTAKSGDVLTITRQQESTAPRTILVGDQVAQAMTAKFVTELIADYKAYADAAVATLQTYVDNSVNNLRSYVDTRDNQVASQSLLRAPRQWAIQTAATPVFTNIDLYDQVFVYEQASALTMGNCSGAFAEGMGLLVRLRDNGTARAIAWGTGWMSGTTAAALPTTTSGGAKTLSLAFRYNGLAAKFQMLGLAQEP